MEVWNLVRWTLPIRYPIFQKLTLMWNKNVLWLMHSRVISTHYRRSLELIVFWFRMLDKLIFPVITHTTCVTPIRLLVSVSTFMIITVANGSESFTTVFAFVRLFTCMDTDMNKQITSLIELFMTMCAFIIRGINHRESGIRDIRL